MAEARAGEVLLLMGPPGAGKGTQADHLAQVRGLMKLSTGDMLRSHVRRGTDLGAEAQAIMAVGDLVPDDLIVAMVRETLAAQDVVAVVLDGFPRTPVQAAALDTLLAERETGITAAIALEVAEDELVRRLLQRAAEQDRSDDNETTIRTRMQVYQQMTQPLLDYYRQRGKLHYVDGLGSVDDVFARLQKVLA